MVNPVFPISFWVAPPTEPAYYQAIAECGFTVAQLPAQTLAAGRRALDLAHEYGFQGMIVDPRIHRNLPQQEGWEDTVQQVVREYSRHPALWGYFVTDEPSLSHFENLARIVEAFGKYDPERVPYINLWPDYATFDDLGTADYREHVHRFGQVVRPPLLSYDYYGLLEKSERPTYFSNLRIIRDEALEADIPFWSIILSTPHWNYRDPSAAELRWQVYTTLAYGGKGISYYTFYTPPDKENYRNGPIDTYGKRTPKYEAIRQLNMELQRLGPHLLRLKSTGIFHWPRVPSGTMPLPSDNLVASLEGGEFVLGFFRDDSDVDWLLIVNQNRESSAYATLVLRAVQTTLSEASRSTGHLYAFPRNSRTEFGQSHDDGMVVHFWLAPADGRLLRLAPPDKAPGR